MKTFKATHLQYIFVVFVFLGVHIFSEAKYTIYNEDECDEKEEGADVGKCIECEIKKMSGTSLKLSQATIDHFGKDDNLKVQDKHKKDNLQIFHCRCLYRVSIFKLRLHLSSYITIMSGSNKMGCFTSTILNYFQIH